MSLPVGGSANIQFNHIAIRCDYDLRIKMIFEMFKPTWTYIYINNNNKKMHTNYVINVLSFLKDDFCFLLCLIAVW